MNDRPSNSWLLATTQHKLIAIQEALVAVLAVLPDSSRAERCWSWCWNELDDAAQTEVKAARKKANIALQLNTVEWREEDL